MDLAKPYWQGRLLNQLQGPSSLGMALSGSAVGFSTSILNPEVYAGFWTSIAFQMHAGSQFLSVAFGVIFVGCRLISNDVANRIEKAQPEDATGHLERDQNRSRRLATLAKSAIYAQLGLLFLGVASFIWLMLLHFHNALYP